MKVGDSSVFAIESEITQAYERPSFLALGFFVLHINGKRYGKYARDASLLRCALDEVTRRLDCRGQHTAPFSKLPDPGGIADSVLEAVYAESQSEHFFGLPKSKFCDVLSANHIIWAPGGDEEFDDGSYVLQFDVEGQCRLIAFKGIDGYRHDQITLNNVLLSSDEFYGILREWRDAFLEEWNAMPKLSDSE